MKFSDFFLDVLESEGYTTCYFVAGGNIMHLLNSARTRFNCVPVVHEVTAAIATEYFNKSNKNGEKAFTLVTAGPGLTNCVTGIAGAFLESRELLILGGQVKSSDLKNEDLRQNGIQEIDGVEIVKSITVKSERLTSPLYKNEIKRLINQPARKGPIFLEFPIDLQAIEMVDEPLPGQDDFERRKADIFFEESNVNMVVDLVLNAHRPVILLGGGLNKSDVEEVLPKLKSLGIPIMTTWNGTEFYGADLPNYWGRPNTWGQRSANVLIQQSDVLIALGTRLGLQQTGFNWEEFCVSSKVVQVEIDQSELDKGHPKVDFPILGDASLFLKNFVHAYSNLNQKKVFSEWLKFGEDVRRILPTNEKNSFGSEYVNPYDFVETLSKLTINDDVIIPCSSGGAFTVTMQSFVTKHGQTFITNKGLASMGYGLAGAIGAAHSTSARTILIEGDGGFSQNLQELGTVKRNNLNLKMFIFDNEGYASIRMTQVNYFDGNYIGCDINTGLGLPNWQKLSESYGIAHVQLDGKSNLESELRDILASPEPMLVVLKIDPEQTYWPKISSKLTENGSMVSNPIHLMSPDLSEEVALKVFKYLNAKI